jgi:hypothetical protein
VPEEAIDQVGFSSWPPMTTPAFVSLALPYWILML